MVKVIKMFNEDDWSGRTTSTPMGKHPGLNLAAAVSCRTSRGDVPRLTTTAAKKPSWDLTVGSRGVWAILVYSRP